LTLAERFGQLDRDSNGIREGARYYILGASFWELNWEQALFYFDQVYRGWSGLWDGTMTATERYRVASMRYGDELFEQEEYCDAVDSYENAQAISQLDQLASQNYAEAYNICNPVIETPVVETATLEPGITVVPTDTPVTPSYP
jgi:hypothetical protein